ncbi:MAG: N-acetylmuramoyl-L-alanine amidase [Treponema sp.]|nr:N-acetylmuramoyl-L-alanine amidase [Treponema sp.]
METSIPLVEKARENGMTFYWDSLSSLGILEKNGHQVTFRESSEVLLYDSILLTKSDSPVIKDGKIYVSASFMGTVENLFKDSDEESPFKIGAILLDPGHGGKDPGASGSFTINGKALKVQEKDVVLSVGKLLYSQLKEAYPEKKIIMTRNTDKYLTLGERTDIANGVKLKENEAVLYVSIHCNASLDKKASGYEVWYLSPGYRRTVIDKSKTEDDKTLFPILNSMMEEEYTTESILMSKFIMDGLQAQIGSMSKARGIKAEEWFVVRNSNMPAVLIEIGFVTNEKEALNLSNPEYLKKSSTGIYNGIQAFVTHFERSRGFTSTK